MKNLKQYDSELRASGKVSILIRKNVPHSKININTLLQAIAVSATQHKTISISSLFIRCNLTKGY